MVRTYTRQLIISGAAIGMFCGCSDADGVGDRAEGASDAPPRVARGVPAGFTSAEWGALRRLSPLPELSRDSTNAVAESAEASELGRQLFCDAGFSGPLRLASDLGEVGESGKVACASCHSGPMLDDRRSSPSAVSIGADLHTRNAPGIVNSSYYVWTNWGGRFSAQWELPLPVVESAIIMNSSRLQVAHRILDEYREGYERIFGALEPSVGTDLARFPAAGKPKAADAPDGAWEQMASGDRDIINEVFVNYGKALAAYFRVLISPESDFDAFMAGDAVLGARAENGARLFVGKAGCVTCHSGPYFSDDDFHNLGLPSPTADDGRFRDVPPLLASTLGAQGSFSDDPEAGRARVQGLTNPMPEAARGAFRTANLRGVESSGPYMHAGQLETLEEVVEYYDSGGGETTTGTKDPSLVPLGLSASEKADLVEFLRSLSGEPIAASLLCDD